MPSPPEGARGDPSRGSTWSVGRLEHTWPFLAPMGFTLPVRVMSVLKEISAAPPSKRRGLVNVQGQGTQCGPREIAPWLLSLPFRGGTNSKTPPCLQRRCLMATQRAELELLTTPILLGRGLGGLATAVMPTRSYTSGDFQGLRKNSERFPGHPNGMLGAKLLEGHLTRFSKSSGPSVSPQ